MGRLAVPAPQHHLVRGSVLAAVAVGLNGLGGFAFWAVLARWEAAPEVGRAQGLFTAILVVTYLTSLGLPVAVARFSCDRSEPAAAFFRISIVATSVSSVVGTAGLVVLASSGGLLRPLDGMHVVMRFGVLTVLAVGMSCAVLVEVRLMALRRWGWVVARVAFVVVARFPLLLVVPEDVALWSFLLVAGLPAATGLFGALGLWLRHGPKAVPLRLHRRAWTRYSLVNYVSLLGAQGPQFLVPLAVAVKVSSAEFAPFYLAWGATAIVFLIPHMAGQALLTESAKASGDRIKLGRTSLAMSVGATSVIAASSFGADPVVRILLGPAYSTIGDVLPWMLGASVPWAVTAVALADARARAASGAVIAITSAFFGATLLAVLLGVGWYGVTGAAVGWFAGNVAVAAGAATVLVPELWQRRLRVLVLAAPVAVEPVRARS